MPFPEISTINTTADPTELLVYANDLTGGILMPGFLAAFFIVVCLGSFFAQMRFSGRGRFELSFAVAGFTTFGLAVIMSAKNGLLNPIYILASLAVAIVGAGWLYLSQE